MFFYHCTGKEEKCQPPAPFSLPQMQPAAPFRHPRVLFFPAGRFFAFAHRTAPPVSRRIFFSAAVCFATSLFLARPPPYAFSADNAHRTRRPAPKFGAGRLFSVMFFGIASAAGLVFVAPAGHLDAFELAAAAPEIVAALGHVALNGFVLVHVFFSFSGGFCRLHP